MFKLKVGKDTKVLVKAYNDMADWCYQNLARKDIVLIQGELNSKMEIVISEIEIIWSPTTMKASYFFHSSNNKFLKKN